jgi:hypothetical protein
VDLEAENLKLEERKFEKESGFRERELRVAEEDVQLKKDESKKPAWRDPIFIAVLAASIGFLGNVIVAGIQGYYSHRQIQDKAAVDEQLARENADSALILEASKGDYQTRANNLRSLVDLGLISDPQTSKRLGAQLVSGILPNTSVSGQSVNGIPSQPSSASGGSSTAGQASGSNRSPASVGESIPTALVAEKTVAVPPGDYALTSNPSCSNPDVENVTAIASAILSKRLDAEFPELKTLSAGGGQTRIFPANSTASSSQGGDIAQLLAPTRSASCAIIVVNLPSPTAARVEVSAADGSSTWSPCTEQSGPWLICQIGWSGWTYKISDGVVVATFKNWSGDRQRGARIRIYQ